MQLKLLSRVKCSLKDESYFYQRWDDLPVLVWASRGLWWSRRAGPPRCLQGISADPASTRRTRILQMTNHHSALNLIVRHNLHRSENLYLIHHQDASLSLPRFQVTEWSKPIHMLGGEVVLTVSGGSIVRGSTATAQLPSQVREALRNFERCLLHD